MRVEGRRTKNEYDISLNFHLSSSLLRPFLSRTGTSTAWPRSFPISTYNAINALSRILCPKDRSFAVFPDLGRARIGESVGFVNWVRSDFSDMRKRERENPCGVCGHYHKFEEGEVCGVCGHRRVIAESDKGSSSVQVSAFPTEILPHFLYLGSYDNASRSELLETLGVSCILNTVPSCQNLYKYSFTYHCLQDDKNLQFDDANQYLEQCERDKTRVLVHCMLGKNRSPAIVIAYLMKSRGWSLSQSYQWVKERRPCVELTEGVYKQLQEYEGTLFRPTDGFNVPLPVFPSFGSQSFSSGLSKQSNPVHVPTFSSANAISISSQPIMNIPPQEFTFGASQPVQNVAGLGLTGSSLSSNCGDISMDSP